MAGKRRGKQRGNGEGSLFQLPDGTWRGTLTVGYDTRGKQVKRWVRGKTRREAAGNLDAIRHLVGSVSVGNRERLTVAEWMERFVALRSRDVRPRTVENYRHYLSKIVPVIGGVALRRLTALQVRALYARLQDDGLSPSVRKHVHHFLKAAYRDAERMELVDRNPVAMVDAPTGGQLVKAQVWSPEQLTAYLAAARNERLFSAMYLMAGVGLRAGETLGLHWSDLEGDRLTIQRTLGLVGNRPSFGPPKTERGWRTVYLSADAVGVLEERRELQMMERGLASSGTESDLVFTTGRGTPVNQNNMRRIHRRVLASAGLPRIRVHDLRHTYITLARDAGVDAEVLANRVGQDVRVTIRIYSQVTETRKRKAALSLAELTHG